MDNATTFVFSSGMTVTRMVVAKNPEHWYLTRPLRSSRTSLVSCKVEHPSEPVDVKKFWAYLLLFAVLPLATRFKSNVSYGLLTGDAFVSNESRSFHERKFTVPFVRILPETPRCAG